ncbi:MAG: peptidyl-prolyl cis-trans isomerase [bacterium]
MRNRMLIFLMICLVLISCSREKNQAESKQAKVLAKIGNKQITMKDLEERYASMPPFIKQQINKPDGRRRLLKAMIDEEVIVREAESRGFERTSQFRTEMERRRKDALINLFVDNVIGAAARPNEEEMKRYYEDNKDRFTEPAKANARHILTKTEREALEVKSKLLAGMDFAEAARKYSIDAVTNQRGGVIPGEITQEGDVPGLGRVAKLVDAIFSMNPGEIGGPIKTELGYHIVKVEAKNPARLKEFERVKDQIESQIKLARQGAVRDSIMDALMKKYRVVFLEGEDVDMMGPDELFKQASEESDIRQKIKYYEMFLKKFPDNPRAYEAKFMIGFTLAEELHDYDGAEKVLKEFLEQYPNNDLTDDAIWMLENMRSGTQMPSQVENIPSSR